MTDRTPADLIGQCDAITEGVTPEPWQDVDGYVIGASGAIVCMFSRTYGPFRDNARFIAASRTLLPAMRDALAQAEERLWNNAAIHEEEMRQAEADVRTLLEIIDELDVADSYALIPNIRARYQEDAGE